MYQEFNYYLLKLQALIGDNKLQSLFERKKSRVLVNVMTEFKKEKMEKIKILMKETEKDAYSISKELIDDLNANKGEEIINKEITNQEENFKKKLEDKRTRGYSQPNKFKNEMRKKAQTVYKKQTTPPKRASKLAMHTFKLVEEEKVSFKKSNLQIDTDNNKNTENNIIANSDLNDNDYDKQIENNLIKIWEVNENKIKDEIEAIDLEKEKLLDEIANEKYKRTFEISQKYDLELKDLQDDVDFNDNNNINTIIYNQLKTDKEKEINELIQEIEKRKKDGVNTLKAKANQIRFNNEKNSEILKAKENITQGIKNKILKSFTPQYYFKNKIEFNYENSQGFFFIFIFSFTIY